MSEHLAASKEVRDDLLNSIPVEGGITGYVRSGFVTIASVVDQHFERVGNQPMSSAEFLVATGQLTSTISALPPHLRSIELRKLRAINPSVYAFVMGALTKAEGCAGPVGHLGQEGVSGVGFTVQAKLERVTNTAVPHVIPKRPEPTDYAEAGAYVKACKLYNDFVRGVQCLQVIENKEIVGHAYGENSKFKQGWMSQVVGDVRSKSSDSYESFKQEYQGEWEGAGQRFFSSREEITGKKAKPDPRDYPDAVNAYTKAAMAHESMLRIAKMPESIPDSLVFGIKAGVFPAEEWPVTVLPEDKALLPNSDYDRVMSKIIEGLTVPPECAGITRERLKDALAVAKTVGFESKPIDIITVDANGVERPYVREEKPPEQMLEFFAYETIGVGITHFEGTVPESHTSIYASDVETDHVSPDRVTIGGYELSSTSFTSDGVLRLDEECDAPILRGQETKPE